MRDEVDVVPILEDLIRIPSVNPARTVERDPQLLGEGRVNEYLIDFIRAAGLDPIVQESDPPGRGNVGAMLFTGRDRKTIVLQSHTDTVGVDNNHELLNPRVEGGCVYGRGACDDKGGLAAMLAALVAAAGDTEAVANNVVVMGVSDEEAGGSGCAILLAQEPTMTADFGVVGEPTGCRIVNACKGTARWDIEVHGQSSHSSEPHRGVNAIYRMGRVLNAIESYVGELEGIDDPLLGHETISVGRIGGGISVNVVPDHCRIEVDRRLTRLFDPKKAQTHLDAYLKQRELGFPHAFSELRTAQPGFVLRPESAIIGAAQSASVAVDLSTELRQVPYGSDAMRMNRQGMPTILWGPGDIDEAHSSEECVEISQLESARDFYLMLMRHDLREYEG